MTVIARVKFMLVPLGEACMVFDIEHSSSLQLNRGFSLPTLGTLSFDSAVN